MSLRRSLQFGCCAAALLGCSKAPTASSQPSGATVAPSAVAPLKLAGAVDLPGYAGDFDHFAIDAKDGRLFLAGEESAELEVFDLKTGKIIERMRGYGVPHSVLYMPETNEILVVDGEKPSPVLDAASLRVKRTYNLPKGADSVGYDSSSKHLWVVTGGKDVNQKDSNLVEIDPATGKTFKSVHFDANHVEALAVEQQGPNIYVNITDKNELDVIDKAVGKIVKQIPIREAEQNAPIAIDEPHHRLFVVTRKPGKLLVLDAGSGKTIAALPAPDRTDEVVWDPDNRRIYVAGGQGYISVVEQDGPDKYRETARVKSLPGAKTEIIDSAGNALWVAASPGETKAMAKVLRFDIQPR
jgi:DNA-binding beta-propeller fold protein YncE